MTKAAHQLRFPEFRARPPWRTSTLGEVFSRITNGKANAEDHEEGGTYPLFDRSEVVKASNQFVFDAESVIIPGEGVRFQPRYFVGRFNLHQRAYALMECSGRARFFFHQLDHLKGLLATSAVKSTVLSLRLPIIEGFPVRSPEPDEQQKIADCLTSLDEVIAAQGRKVEALKAHKKGLMQHLFPQEGQTLPRLRFPEFRDGPEWEQATIGSRSKSFSGGTPTTTNKDYYGGTIPFIRSAEIAEESTELTLTEYGLEHSAAKMVRKGDVLVALYGANSGDVALSRIDGAINQAILCLRPVGSSEFLYHALTERKEWILSTFLQGGQGNLSGDIVKSIFLRFPSSEEQKAVGRCLSSIDELIEAVGASVSGLRRHKAGLMQRLFPQITSD